MYADNDKLPDEWELYNGNNYEEYGGFVFKPEDFAKFKKLAYSDATAILVVHKILYKGFYPNLIESVYYFPLVSRPKNDFSSFIGGSYIFTLSGECSLTGNSIEGLHTFSFLFDEDHGYLYDCSWIVRVPGWPNTRNLVDQYDKYFNYLVDLITMSGVGTRDTSAKTITFDTELPYEKTDMTRYRLILRDEGATGELIARRDLNDNSYTTFYFHFGTFILKITGSSPSKPLPYEQIDLIQTT